MVIILFKSSSRLLDHGNHPRARSALFDHLEFCALEGEALADRRVEINSSDHKIASESGGMIGGMRAMPRWIEQ